MNQREQLVQAMENRGGFATLGQLYQDIDVSNWKTKTPYATIRRIVQNDRYFFKIKPGLWALNSHKERLPKHFDTKVGKQSPHYYYQGLLLEIGNLKKFETFSPNQDKNKKFLNTTLEKVRTLSHIHEFGYEHFVRKAKNIDVSWFNERKMPECFFEVEHSTTMDSSLRKFHELLDFNSKFFIVADKSRKKEFEAKMKSSIYNRLKKRVSFYDYDRLSEWHSSCHQHNRVSPL